MKKAAAPVASSFVVRLRSKDALERVEADRSWTLKQLKEKIFQQTSVPVQDQTLASDAKFTKIFADDTKTLAALGWNNGEMIHFSYKTARTKLPEAPVKAFEEQTKWTVKKYFDHLEAQGLVFTHQKEAHCKECALDYDAVNIFQQYCQQFGFQQQRVGFLYGKYQDNGGVLVEAIYEPPQEGFATHFVLNDQDPQVGRADAIAMLLGMQRVGWIFTHPNRAHMFSALEVMTAARLQLAAATANPEKGKAFVTLKMTQNEEQQGQLEGYQASDQALRLQLKELWAAPDPEKPTYCRVKEKVLMHTKTGGREEHDYIETDVMVTNVPVVIGKSSLQLGFPPENRLDAPQTGETLKRYLTSVKAKTWVQQLSDFHFLLYLSGFLDMKSDMPAICESVRTNNPKLSENFQFLIRSYAGLQ